MGHANILCLIIIFPIWRNTHLLLGVYPIQPDVLYQAALVRAEENGHLAGIEGGRLEAHALPCVEEESVSGFAFLR